jgi:hypothetical protein
MVEPVNRQNGGEPANGEANYCNPAPIAGYLQGSAITLMYRPSLRFPRGIAPPFRLMCLKNSVIGQIKSVPRLGALPADWQQISRKISRCS